MLEDLNQENTVVGAKQTKRALNDGRAVKVLLADDAGPRVTEPLEQLAQEKNIPVEHVPSMKALGAQCGIAVGSASAAQISVRF